MARKRKSKAPQRQVKVASYSRKFDKGKLPPRGPKGRFRRRGPRQQTLF